MVVGDVMNLSKLRRPTALSLSSINHVSTKCHDLKTCLNFYEGVLGFIENKRPGQLGCEGHWLFNYGIGIHLLPLPPNQDEEQVRDAPKEKEISPQDDHISFQCEDIDEVEKQLQENGIRYKRLEVEDIGILIDQVFFHDPNGFMIEVCNCDRLPVMPWLVLHLSQITSSSLVPVDFRALLPPRVDYNETPTFIFSQVPSVHSVDHLEQQPTLRDAYFALINPKFHRRGPVRGRIRSHRSCPHRQLTVPPVGPSAISYTRVLRNGFELIFLPEVLLNRQKDRWNLLLMVC
ncbi:unnamed protein product [Calypogeia fissa]